MDAKIVEMIKNDFKEMEKADKQNKNRIFMRMIGRIHKIKKGGKV